MICWSIAATEAEVYDVHARRARASRQVKQEPARLVELEVFALVSIQVVTLCLRVHFELLGDLTRAEVNAAGLDIKHSATSTSFASRRVP